MFRYLFLLFLVTFAPIKSAPNSLQGALNSQIALDIARITRTADRYQGGACVGVYASITRGRRTFVIDILAVNCPAWPETDGRGWLDFTRVDSRLESALITLTTNATRRAVNVANRKGANICIEYAVDFADRRGRPGNFTATNSDPAC